MFVKNLFFILTFTIFQAQAEPKEYSTRDYNQIEQTVRNAFHANVEELRGSGPFKMQVLSQAITRQPDPAKFPFIGYGKTAEEAQIRAALVCMKWRCENEPRNMLDLIESWKKMPAEKFMDHFNATGSLEEYPAELKADPEKFKNYVLNRKLKQPSCDTFNTIQLTLIYVQCTSVGAMNVSDLP